MSINKAMALALMVLLLALPALAQNGSNVTYPVVPVEINDAQQTGANDTGSRQNLGEAEFNRSNETYQAIKSGLNVTSEEEPEIASGTAGNNSASATENATGTSNALPGFDLALSLAGVTAAAGWLLSKKRQI